MLPEDEKAKHVLFHIGFYIGEELLGMLGWLGKERDLEKLPGSTWRLFLLRGGSLLSLWLLFSSIRSLYVLGDGGQRL